MCRNFRYCLLCSSFKTVLFVSCWTESSLWTSLQSVAHVIVSDEPAKEMAVNLSASKNVTWGENWYSGVVGSCSILPVNPALRLLIAWSFKIWPAIVSILIFLYLYTYYPKIWWVPFSVLQRQHTIHQLPYKTYTLLRFFYYGSAALEGPKPPLWGSSITLKHTTLRLFLASDQPLADSSTWHHATLTTDRHPCLQRDLNPQPQQASGRSPTP